VRLRSRLDRRWVMLAAVVCLSAVGCGTTVSDPAQRQATGAGADAGLGATGEQLTGPDGGSTPRPGGATAPDGGSAAVGSVGPTGAVGPTTSTSGGPGQHLGGGSVTGTRGPIKIGFMLIDFTSVAHTFGFSGSADVFKGFKEMVGYLNKHGGLAGRQIKPDYYAIDGAGSDANTEYQKACTHFIQDEHVDLVISDGNFHPTFEACMAQAHLTHFDVSTYGFDAKGQAQYPLYLTPTAFGVDRYSKALIDTAVGARMVSSGQRIGVLIEGCAPNVRAYDDVWVPVAESYGLKVEAEQTLCNNGTADLGTETSQIQNAVLKFRSDGVTSVSFISFNEGFIAALFAQGAEQQKWRPHYLLTSVGLPERAVESQGSALSVPPAQLPQMRGMGWTPVSDVGHPPPGSAAQQAQQALCKKMSPSQAGAADAPDAGVRRDFLGHFLRECDMLLLVRQMTALTGGSVALADIRSVYGKALTSLVSASNLNGAYHVSGSRTDGVFAAAPFAYSGSCKCMEYTGRVRTFR